MEAYVKFFGGLRGIGGNQILVVASNGKSILLDFGYDFGIANQFFDDFMKVRNKMALVDGTTIGLIPWPEGELKGIYRSDLYSLNLDCITKSHQIYRSKKRSKDKLELEGPVSVKEVIVSHAHLDHIGGIKYLNPKIKIICSKTTKKIMERLEATSGSSSSFRDIVSYKPIGLYKDPTTVRVGISPRISDLIPIERSLISLDSGDTIVLADGGLKVTLIEIDHSLPGASGFLIEDTVTHQRLVYTGDIRQHGPFRDKTLEFIQQVKSFKPDTLITEGTRITPDPDLSEYLSEIDGRKDEISDEESVLESLNQFLRNIQSNDPEKSVFFNCSGRDLWRIGTFYRAAKENCRTLVVDPKIFDILFHLDSSGKIFGIDLEQIKVYIARKNWGIYEYDDYTNSQAIKEVLKYPPEDFSKLLDNYNERLKIQYDEKQNKKQEEYEAKMKDWEEKGKLGRKPTKPRSTTFKLETLEDLPQREYFWADAPIKIDAKEIHNNQGKYLVYLPPYSLNELFDIQPDPKGYYVSSKSGPFDEEGVLDDRRRDNWFKLFDIPKDDIHFGHFHCSGHMPEEDLFRMIEEIEPKNVILVHSKGKQKFISRFNGKIKGIAPKLEEKYII